MDTQAIRIGLQYVIRGLVNWTELNGRVVTAELLPDDNGRVLVSCDHQRYRLLCQNLVLANGAA